MKKITFASILSLLAVLLTAAIIQGQREEKKPERAGQNRPPTRVSVENGETVVNLNAQDQQQLAITVAPLQSFVQQEQISAPAVVLPVQDLATLRDGYIAARTRLEKARVERGVVQKEYERLQTLYQDNQNVTEKSLEAQQGLAQSSEAEVRAAGQQLRLQKNVAQQQWGGIVAGWLAHDSLDLERILDQRDLLVQITLPSGTRSKPPRTALLEFPGGRPAPAHLVSAYPRVDSRIQGVSFLYLTSAHRGLVSGLNLIVHLPVGGLRRGVVIPQSAVVWWQGEQWVYQQTAPERFTRRQLSASGPLPNGLFVTGEFSLGDKVVVGGTQLLLSEESRPATQAGQEADTD